MRTIERLVEHVAWADLEVASALREQPQAKALELFAHVVGTELNWLDRIAGRARRLAIWPSGTLDELLASARTAHAELRALALSPEDDSFLRAVTYRTSDGREFTSTVEDILVHVSLHGQHHRAQIATLLREAGVRPPSLDYVAWARGGAAATRS